jgi:hypothetical protein
LNRRRVPSPRLASPVERPHKTKNKSKRNQSTVQTETSYRTETTPTVPKLCEYSQLCLSVCCRVQCRILSGQNRTHTCCIVFARANSERCCEFVMTASWSISKGMGKLREL